jgi:hypothetical protein
MLGTYAPAGDVHPVTGVDNADIGYADRVRETLKRYEAAEAGRDDQSMSPRQVPITIEQKIAWNRAGQYGALQSQDAHVTVHENGNENAGVDAYAEQRFVASGGGSESVLYHFAVDHIRVVQITPLNFAGRHAGNATGNAISIAIETCQAAPGPLSDATQNNLKWLLVAIVTRDPRINFGGDEYHFSFTRMRGHKDWPNANPRCPKYMIARFGGVETVISGARKLAAGFENPEPPKFKKGDIVRTTAELNARIGPGLTYELSGTLPLGTSGIVIKDGPVYEGGFEWYDGIVSKTWGSAWMAGEYLEAAADEPEVPEPVRPKIVINYATALRETPAFNGKSAGVAKAGAGAVILEGPRVNQGVNWYRVMIAGNDAWIPDSTSTFREE